MAHDVQAEPKYRRFRELGLETVAYRGPLPYMPPHAHAQYQLSLYDGNPRRFDIAGRKFRGARRAAVIIQAGVLHSSHPIDDDRLALRTFYIDDGALTEVADSIWRGRGTVAFREPSLSHDPTTVARLHAAHQALDDHNLEGDVRFCVAVEQLVRRHATPIGPLRALTEAQTRVARVRELLEDRLTENLRLDALAEVAGLSRFHLIRSFRQQFGLTPFAYQRKQRIERARDVLRNGGSIAEAAVASGFADQSHLGRSFRGTMGATPGEYRRSFVQPSR